MVKIAVLAPMPRARVSTAMAVNPRYPHGVVSVLGDALEKLPTCLSRHNRLAIKVRLDVLKISGKEVFTFEFVESGAKCGVFRSAAGEKVMVAIFAVLRKLIGDLGFARRSKV